MAAQRPAALGIESLAVAVILIATAHGTISDVLHMRRQVPDAYEQYKVRLGKAPLLVVEIEGHWPWQTGSGENA